MPARLPQLNTWSEVVRWVIDELGALCPSEERLRAFAADPNAPLLRDVRYHVREAPCLQCRQRLEALSGGK